MGKKKKQEKQEKLKKQKDKLKKLDKREKAERKSTKPEKKKSGKKPEKAIDYLKVEKTGKAAGGTAKQPEPVKARKAGRRKSGQAGASPDRMRLAAERFRALGDENRLQILTLLEERELCAGDLLKSLSIVQSTLSHHMKILVESGLVTCRKQGKWSYYSLAPQLRGELETLVEQWTRGGK